ncbi:MAG: hypothetical protein R6X11_08310 [Desulfonatronovibrio sp.]
MKNGDTLRSEYPPELIKSGQRGKYAKRYQEEGTSLVFIEPNLLELYPDSEAVSRALRQYAKEHGH